MEELLSALEISLEQVIINLEDLQCHVGPQHKLTVIEWRTIGRLVATGCINGDHAWLDYQPDATKIPTRLEGDVVKNFLSWVVK